jgi:antitoxin StbD
MTTVAGFLEVLPTSEARGELSRALERFRQDGVTAEPLVFGGHRKPEGVVLPFALFERLVPFIEDVLIAETVRQRIDAGGESLPIEGLMTDLGFDPADFE